MLTNYNLVITPKLLPKIEILEHVFQTSPTKIYVGANMGSQKLVIFRAKDPSLHKNFKNSLAKEFSSMGSG
jgi:hypothetical protein